MEGRQREAGRGERRTCCIRLPPTSFLPLAYRLLLLLVLPCCATRCRVVLGLSAQLAGRAGRRSEEVAAGERPCCINNMELSMIMMLTMGAMQRHGTFFVVLVY
jgi:hypothetical protein